MNFKVLIPAAMWTIAAAFAFSIVIFSFGNDALACGTGKTDGKSFTMNSNYSPMLQKSNLSKAQAIEIVSQHINLLNPNLKLGNVNDTGILYEAEILSATEEEILQVIGVYKNSGQVVVIN